MPSSELHRQIARLTSRLAGRELNPGLQDWLNREHGAGSKTFREIEQTCQLGLAEGWLCQHEAGGIRYGRVLLNSTAQTSKKFAMESEVIHELATNLSIRV